MRGYSFGKISICRIHLALREAPRFANGAEMSRCAFHRIVDSSAQMIRQYAQIAEGVAPTDPFLWSACWTLMDPTPCAVGQAHADLRHLRAQLARQWRDLGADPGALRLTTCC